LEKATVVYVSDGRRKESLDGYFARMSEKARMFRKYLRQILTYFRHRITNAVSEGLNSKIETIRKKTYGFRNREHFKTAIYFHCGGLNLYPVTHKKVG
jgi:transposase